MKQFFKNIFLFALISIAGYFLLVVLIGESGFSSFTKNLNYKIGSPGFMYTRIRDIDKTGNVDVLFIGSSETYRGFDIRIFRDSGYSCFNLGSSAQTPQQTALLLKRYLDKLKPKVVVFEASPASFMNDGVESELDIIANDKVDMETVKNSFSLKNLKIYNAVIYGLYRQLGNRNNGFKEVLTVKDDQYIPGGFVEKQIRYFNPSKSPKETPVKFTPIPYQENAFDQIIKLTKEKGIGLFVVQAPVCRMEIEKYLNSNSVDSFFQQRAMYLNFNNRLHLEDSVYFFDKVHLNQLGVKRFDSAVINDILKPFFKR